MLIDEAVKRFYPVYKSSNDMPEVDRLGKELDRIYNHGGTWTINGIRPSMGEVAELYDVYKYIVKDGCDLNTITTVSDTVMRILKSLGFHVEERGVGWALAESDDMDLAQPKGTFSVMAFGNDFMEPVGPPKRFNTPAKAIEQWLKLSKKYPTCVTIDGYAEQEKELRDWVVNNEQEFIGLYDRYGCPYKLDYLLDACRQPVRRRNDDYPDQCYPFCLG